MEFIHWILVPFTIFWSCYFSLGLGLYWARCRQFGWYQRLALKHRANDKIVLNASHFRVLAKNVAVTVVGSTLFFFIFGYPSSAPAASDSIMEELIYKPIIAFLIADAWFYHNINRFSYLPGL